MTTPPCRLLWDCCAVHACSSSCPRIFSNNLPRTRSIICDASFPTTMLTHWGRDRTAGPKFELPWIIKRQTGANAQAIGLGDRGLLAPGYQADVDVIDFGKLNAWAPRIVTDLPDGGRRVMQPADGFSSAASRSTPAGSRPASFRDGWSAAHKVHR